jgi:hypothetical protein
MIYSIFLYILLAILTIALPHKYQSKHRLLLSVSSFFMGTAIITAIFHSDLDRAKWIVVGLNSIGMMSFYLRYRLLNK